MKKIMYISLLLILLITINLPAQSGSGSALEKKYSITNFVYNSEDAQFNLYAQTLARSIKTTLSRKIKINLTKAIDDAKLIKNGYSYVISGSYKTTTENNQNRMNVEFSLRHIKTNKIAIKATINGFADERVFDLIDAVCRKILETISAPGFEQSEETQVIKIDERKKISQEVQQVQQETEEFQKESKIWLGGKIGLSDSLFIGENGPWQMGFGFHFGFDSMFYFFKFFGLKIEANYNYLSGKTNEYLFYEKQNFNFHLLTLSACFFFDVNGWLPNLGIYVGVNLKKVNISFSIYPAYYYYNSNAHLGIKISLISFTKTWKKVKLLFAIEQYISINKVVEEKMNSLPFYSNYTVNKAIFFGTYATVSIFFGL